MATQRNWRKKKTIGMYLNRRQWEREFDVNESSALEIELEQGGYLVIESSQAASPNYIITE
jgi:hypothetical protein